MYPSSCYSSCGNEFLAPLRCPASELQEMCRYYEKHSQLRNGCHFTRRLHSPSCMLRGTGVKVFKVQTLNGWSDALPWPTRQLHRKSDVKPCRSLAQQLVRTICSLVSTCTLRPFGRSINLIQVNRDDREAWPVVPDPSPVPASASQPWPQLLPPIPVA